MFTMSVDTSSHFPSGPFKLSAHQSLSSAGPVQLQRPTRNLVANDTAFPQFCMQDYIWSFLRCLIPLNIDINTTLSEKSLRRTSFKKFSISFMMSIVDAAGNTGRKTGKNFSPRNRFRSRHVRIYMSSSQKDHDCVCQHTILGLRIHELSFKSFF